MPTPCCANGSPQRTRAGRQVALQSAAKRASQLAADLLDFTQARLGGGLPVKASGVDVHALLRDCVEELRFAGQGRALLYEASGTAHAFCDPARVAQVVSNLVNNAFAYGTAGTPVTVRTVVTSEMLRISVHNFGPPIPTHLMPVMFEALQRGEQEVQSGVRSVGLGLYIVREIAAAHGGSVQVQSIAEDGTTFVVSIPQPARE